MANRSARPAPEGETRCGTSRNGIRGAFAIESGANYSADGQTAGAMTAAGNPAVLYMDSVTSAGVKKTWALWVDGSGNLRIVETGDADAAAVITNEASSGTKVGSQ